MSDIFETMRGGPSSDVEHGMKFDVKWSTNTWFGGSMDPRKHRFGPLILQQRWINGGWSLELCFFELG